MYKKPPIQHQFKKGQSGNPKGRPKAEDIIMVELAAKFMQLLLEARARKRASFEKLQKIRKIMAG